MYNNVKFVAVYRRKVALAPSSSYVDPVEDQGSRRGGGNKSKLLIGIYQLVLNYIILYSSLISSDRVQRNCNIIYQYFNANLLITMCSPVPVLQLMLFCNILIAIRLQFSFYYVECVLRSHRWRNRHKLTIFGQSIKESYALE